ncbi:MAG TPA: VIT1/CCC1 transporter family protein, partial [Acidimicrobiia bacterium]
MVTTAPDAKRIRRLREMYADEVNGGALFRGLAKHADEARREVFLQLAAAEHRHAEHWARLLREAGVEPHPPRRPFRVRALCFLARILGTEAVLPLMLRTEAAEADRYREDSEATDAMAAQEAAAGRTIAAMQGIPEGGRIARSEGRHRAGVGGVLRATVFGANDGLVSNFSLVMGVAGGTSDNSIVLLAGIAGVVAGAFSMASGEWISIRSQRELYENELRIEQEELR